MLRKMRGLADHLEWSVASVCSLHSRDRSDSPLPQRCVLAANDIKNWQKYPNCILRAITSIFGDVSLHFQNLLTLSWQGLVQRWMKTFGSEIQEVMRVHQRSRTVLMQQIFFLIAFFSTYYTFSIRFRSGLRGGQIKWWNVVPSLPVFSFSRSVTWGIVVLEIPLFSNKIPGSNRP